MKTKTKPNKTKKTFLKPLRSMAITALSLFAIFTIVKAGNITPPTGAPTAQFYSLSEIYQFITNNTTATQGGHSFDFSDALSSTHHTLTEIYDALASLISANKVKLGTTYLGATGTLTPDGGTAIAADLFNAKTSHLTGDWDLDSGTLNLACNTATFDGTDNLVPNAYDGNEIGNNRWCVTDTGDAIAGEILSGKKAWIDGIEITGSLATQILTADSETVAAGNYIATTLSAVDGDLSTANIKSGITLFGIDGNSNVVNTSTGDAVEGDILSGKIGWIAGLAITGTMANIGQQPITPATTNTAITQGYHNGSGYCAGDSNLISANIKSEINLFGVAGDSNVVNTSTGDAIATDILSGKIGWVDGSEITGSIASCSSEGGNACYVASGYWTSLLGDNVSGADGSKTFSISNGYYSGKTATANDTNLVSGNIANDVTIFGVTGNLVAGYTYGDNNAAYVLVSATGDGTALKDLFNGTDTAESFPGGSQANGGVEDYNNGGSAPSDRYSKGWTQCDEGNSYCGTDDSGADAKDDSTGLIWSLPCNGSGCSSFSDSSPLEYSWDNSEANNNSRTASQLCSDHSGWSLPHQKQLMQAYIDGSYDNLVSSSDVCGYWSGTTVSNFTITAWITYLSVGYTHSNSKASEGSVRCVRPAT